MTTAHPLLPWFVRAGVSDLAIARHYGVDPRTVLRWRQADGLASSWEQKRKPGHHLAAYSHGCRCDVCRKASRDHAAAHKAIRRTRTAANGGVAPIEKHGYTTATNWGCRCDVCVAAVSVKNRADYERRTKEEVQS